MRLLCLANRTVRPDPRFGQGPILLGRFLLEALDLLDHAAESARRLDRLQVRRKVGSGAAKNVHQFAQAGFRLRRWLIFLQQLDVLATCAIGLFLIGFDHFSDK
jgi:hypothetical protein